MTGPPPLQQRHQATNHRSEHGFTLVELMVAMLLGMIVIAGAGSIFLANFRSYHTNRALSEVQSNVRTAFELMARDIRQAGLTGCGNGSRVANILKNSPSNGGTTWWANWDNAVHGYGAGDPALANLPQEGHQANDSTQSLQLIGATGNGFSIRKHDGANEKITLDGTITGLQQGDIAIVCDFNHATIAQITGISGGNTVFYAADSGTPGNCSTDLRYPTICGSTATSYQFPANSILSRLSAHDWYIGINSQGEKSLYRLALGSTTPQEIVPGVTHMNLEYHTITGHEFVKASGIGNWRLVDAVRVQLTLESTGNPRAGTDGDPIQRTFTATTTIRNRVN